MPSNPREARQPVLPSVPPEPSPAPVRAARPAIREVRSSLALTSFVSIGPPFAPVTSCFSANPRSRAIMLAFSRSAAAPVNFWFRMICSTCSQIGRKSCRDRYSSQVRRPISKKIQRPAMVIARILATGTWVATPWNEMILSSINGLASTHSKYSPLAVHNSSGEAKMGLRP